MIIEKIGNLLESPDSYIIHGVNCSGGFGSGVAGQIAKKYPYVREAYLRKYNAEGWHLGEIQFVATEYGRYIVNAATQQRFGGGGQQYADYNAITLAITGTIVEACHREWARTGKLFTEFGVSINRIGCGLGGAKWEIVKEILSNISQVFPFVKITVWSLNGSTTKTQSESA